MSSGVADWVIHGFFGRIGRWFKEDFAKKNFSIYGQWIGVVAMILCIVTGVLNIFDFRVTAWAIIAIITGGILLIVEVQWLMKWCCPPADWIVKFGKLISHNYPRAAVYIIFSVLQFLSTRWGVTSLVAAGVFLLAAGICFLIAGVTNQTFAGSKILGNASTSEMIV